MIVDSQVRRRGAGVRRRRPDRHVRPERGRADFARTTTSSTLQQDVLTETNYVMFHLTKPQLQDREVRCALVQAIDKQELDRRHLRRATRAVQRPVLARPGGLPRGHRAARVRPRGRRRGDRGVRGRERPARDPRTRRRRPARPRRSPTTSSRRGATSASTSRRTPIEQSVLITNALLGAPEFEAFGWRNHAGLFVDTQNSLVARLRLRRLRRGDGRRRAVAQLRPPQRPRDQRPARPGPQHRRTPTSARRSPRRSTGSSPASAGSSRLS